MAKAAAKEEPKNQFDARRETLVVERKTTWPAGVELAAAEQDELADSLHADPQKAAMLEYIRCPTGFIRHITVTAEEIGKSAG